MKERKSVQKLVLNKSTVSNLDVLSREAQRDILAAYKGCWENLWTLYYCKLIWTGDQKPETYDCNNPTVRHGK